MANNKPKRILTDKDFLRIDAECKAIYGEEIPPKETWTVNGEPISEAIANMLPFEHTDQGIGRRLARKAARGMAHTETVRDEADKKIVEKFRDARLERRVLSADEMKAVEGNSGSKELLDFADPDPLRTCARANVPPGMAYRFLDDRTCKDQGLRGYEILKDKNGNEVRVGTLRLGVIPQEVANYRFTQQKIVNEAPMKELRAAAKKKQMGDDKPLKGSSVKASEDNDLTQDPAAFHEDPATSLHEEEI